MSDRIEAAIAEANRIPGWMTLEELRWLATRAAACPVLIIEVGSWQGRSTKALAAASDAIVYAVDTWQGSEEHAPGVATRELSPEAMYDAFQSHLAFEILTHQVIPWQMTSLTAAGEFSRLLEEERIVLADLVFIDGDHRYEQVKQDIEAYRPLVRHGGILAGHDHHSGPVSQAVSEVLGGPEGTVHNSLWWVTIP